MRTLINVAFCLLALGFISYGWHKEDACRMIGWTGVLLLNFISISSDRIVEAIKKNK